MSTALSFANDQNLIRLQKKLRKTLLEFSLNWHQLERQDIVLQLLEEWQADYREGEEERYAADRIKAVQWLDTQIEKRLKAEKAVVPDWHRGPVETEGEDMLEELSPEILAAIPVAVDATLDIVQSIELPTDEAVLQKRLSHYAQQATRRLEKVTQELNANLEKTNLDLQQHLQVWHGACQKLLMESEGERNATESVRIHALLAMSAETYLYWQRMVVDGWQATSELSGGMPPYHLTARMLSDRAVQAALLAAQCLQDIMLNWFRIDIANQDMLLAWLSDWSTGFIGLERAMDNPSAVEQLEMLADELDNRSSRMRHETEGWINFGSGQRLPGIGIPYEIRELLETIASAREEALENASEKSETQRLYEYCVQILPALHEIAKNLQVITDDYDADEMENWVHLQMNGFIHLSKISRSHAARAAGLFADILDERIDLERDVRADWLRLTKKEWDAAQPQSPEKAGVMMGQAILRMGKIRHHRPDDTKNS